MAILRVPMKSICLPRCLLPGIAMALMQCAMGLACAQAPVVASALQHTNGQEASDPGAVQEVILACPLGGQSFNYRVARFSVARGYALDMQPYGTADLPWLLPECPGNGFVLYKQRFSTTEVQRLRSVVEQRGFAVHPVYYRAFLMARTLEEPLQLQLQLLQRATWRGGSPYRYQALSLLERLLADSAQTERARLDLLLLQAEYQRRLGQFEAAQRSVELAVVVEPEVLKTAKSILQCQQELIAQKNRHASPIPGKQARCGDRID